MIRDVNLFSVLDLIRETGPIRPMQIAKRLGLSLPTVTRAVDDLIRADLVRPHGGTRSARSRTRSVEFNAKAYAVVGIDLGGSKLFGTVADLAGNIQKQVYAPWRDDGAERSIDQVCELITELLNAPSPAGQRIRGIGVGAPGVTRSEEGMVTWAPGLGWRDLALKGILSSRFKLPVFVENDVNLAALGEWAFGAGKGARNMVCIAIGTGIGAGVIVDGGLYHGSDEAAGEIGYLLPGIEFLGRRYDRFGALESLASGTGIADRARRYFANALEPAQITAERVFAAARLGESWAVQVVNETVDYLALAVANISCLLNPELVVIGGGVARSADLLIEPIRRRLEGTVPYIPKLVASSLGSRAAVMGAIILVLKETTEPIVVRRRSKAAGKR